MTLRKSISTVPFDFELKKALLFYANHKANQNLAVMFDCIDDGLVNPEPFSGDQVRELIPDNTETREIYLANTLYFGTDRLVWWRKECKRTLRFTDDTKQAYNLPALVLKVHRGRLHIASLGPRHKKHYDLQSDMPIYHTPFRGIDVHGTQVGVCNVIKPKLQRMKDREEWENAFFKSKFNQRPDMDAELKPFNKTLSEFIFQ